MHSNEEDTSQFLPGVDWQIAVVLEDSQKGVEAWHLCVKTGVVPIPLQIINESHSGVHSKRLLVLQVVVALECFLNVGMPRLKSSQFTLLNDNKTKIVTVKKFKFAILPK